MVKAFSFRQSLSQGNGIGRLRIDNLVIASTFDPVLERPSTAPPSDSLTDSESETQPLVPNPWLQFWPGDIQSISEGDTELLLRLTLHPDEDQPVTVSLRTSGTATSGLDYHELPDSIVFDPDGTAELLIRVIDDSDLEETEILSLEFKTSGDNEMIDPSPLHFEILDNDRIGHLFPSHLNSPMVRSRRKPTGNPIAGIRGPPWSKGKRWCSTINPLRT